MERKMKKKLIIVSALIMAMLIILACGISFAGSGLSDEAKLQTAVAETVSAIQPSQALPTQTPQPTQAQQTAVPTSTQFVPPTQTPQPCNDALFISETIPDDTQFNVGDNFVKTWRFKNIGTCTWNTNYKLVFAEGDKMSGPSSKNLAGSVAPGEQTDISVNLKAPSPAGTYKGFWKVQDDQGQFLVNNIWVQIKVKAIVGPPPSGKPDLLVTEFSINPATPTMGDPAHVRVRVKNNGPVDSGGFTVKWYGLSTFASASCSWNVAGGIESGSGKSLECDYTFASWYPINKTSIVYDDTGSTVNESNESNNTATISPFGVNP
jgi:hypothetical protein